MYYKIIFPIILFSLAQNLFAFDIIEKKFKNNVQLEYNQRSGGSYFDYKGDNKTEFIRYVDSIRYINDELSPISYIFDKKESVVNISAKYFVLENLAVNGKINSLLMSLKQKEFFYYGVEEYNTNQKISYNLKDKSNFYINDYNFGMEYYLTKENFISAVNVAYSFSGVSNKINFNSTDTNDITILQYHISKEDSTLINSNDFTYSMPNVLSIGGILGYATNSTYIELGSNYLSRSDNFKNQLVSYLGVELKNNKEFKLKTQIQYTKVLDDLDNYIPYRPFKVNPQEENLNISAGLSFIKDNICLEFYYGQTIYAKNSLSWGQFSINASYFFD